MPERRSPAETFEELAMPLFDQLYNFARWLTQDASEAEDLVQETYAKALRGFAGFQVGTNFRAWMYRVLRNTFLTSRAGLKSAGSSEEELEVLASTDPSPEAILVDKANREMVQQSLAELPLQFRDVLLLCEVEEMSYAEIAQVLAIPIGTVMSRLHRARKTLRQLLIEKLKGGTRGL